MHEAFHGIARTSEASNMAQSLIDQVDQASDTFEAYKASLKRRYEDRGVRFDLSDAAVAEELAADWFGGITEFWDGDTRRSLDDAFHDQRVAIDMAQAIEDGIKAVAMAQMSDQSRRGPPDIRYSVPDTTLRKRRAMPAKSTAANRPPAAPPSSEVARLLQEIERAYDRSDRGIQAAQALERGEAEKQKAKLQRKMEAMRAVAKERKQAASKKGKEAVFQSAEKRLEQITGQPIEKRARSIRSYLTAAFDTGLKQGREKGYSRTVEDAINSAFWKIVRDNADHPERGIRKIQIVAERVADIRDRMKEVGENETAVDDIIADGLMDMFGAKHYALIRRSTRGKRIQTLAAIEMQIQRHLGRAYSRALTTLITGARTDPRKFYNNTRAGIRLGDQWESALREFGIDPDRLNRIKRARSRIAYLKRTKAEQAEIDKATERAKDLRNAYRDQLASMEWGTLKSAYETLAAIRAQSDRMQDEVKVGQMVRRGELGEKAAAEVEQLPEIKGGADTAKHRGVARQYAHDTHGDAHTRALSLSGGNDNGINTHVFDKRLQEGESKALTTARDVKVAFEQAKAENDVTDRDTLAWYTERRPHTAGAAKVELTDAELMELYALTQDEEAAAKLYKNGFKPDRRRGKFGPRYHIKGKNEEETKLIVADLVGNLTGRQRTLVDRMVELVTGMGSEGNEVSVRLYGREIFYSDGHWRIKVDRGDTEQQSAEVKDLAEYKAERLDRLGMTFDRIPHRHALLIGNVFETFNDQVTQMSDFIGLTEVVVDALYVMQHPEFSTVTAERFGTEFKKRTRSMLARLSHLKSHGDHWNALQRTAAFLERNVSAGILGYRPTSVLNNRIGGSLLVYNELFKISPQLALDFGRRVGPVRFRWSQRNREIRDKLMRVGFFYHRWVVDQIRVFGNLPTDERASALPKSRVRLLKRKIQSKALHPMALAEIRNTVQLCKTLHKAGYSEPEIMRMAEQITRTTQNPSSALEESGLYEDVKTSGGMGLVLPFLGQPTVASNILRNDVLRLRHAIKTKNGRRKAAANVWNDILALEVNSAVTIGQRWVVRSLATGAVYAALFGGGDDEEERRRGLMYSWSDFATDTMDNFIPGLGRAFDNLSRLLMRRESGMENLASRAISQFGIGLNDIAKGVDQDDPNRTARGALRAGEAVGLLLGAPVGGPVQVTRATTGALGEPLRRGGIDAATRKDAAEESSSNYSAVPRPMRQARPVRKARPTRSPRHAEALSR